ncbi:PLD nuclease N-terminal domain-containing protein [Catellatospora methionotrophica]|uniref:PLD nuclease N-terminal domain-containing protein n=1 Tax=Catellatospora methionotrophica TaxID=121620 RepID=UPI001407A69C|nr:PLD nuclease N-terminal domain-containing protein [Catellatospora methionotrophica]
MGRLWLFIFLAQTVLTVAALISCLSAEEHRLNALPRWGWVLIILFFPPIGAIAWFVVGREATPSPKVWRQGSGFPEAQRPGRALAPDDDPEFLRRIAKEQQQTAADDRELLSKWEMDLRRREEELRKQDKADD